MLNTTIKYSLLVISIWGLAACSSPRTITIEQERSSPVKQPVATTPRQRVEIKEEILLGRGSQNSSLGNRVHVPINNPSLGQIVNSDADENMNTDRTPVARNEAMERMPFPVEEYKYVKKRGRSTVSGKIYLENSHTSMKINGNKTKLWLNPVTSYSRQWYHESHLGGYKLSKTDKRLYNYLKFTYSNNSGTFNFFGVPAGDYYLTGTITCSEECGFNQSKSIRLVREISVGRGVTTVDLTKSVP